MEIRTNKKLKSVTLLTLCALALLHPCAVGAMEKGEKTQKISREQIRLDKKLLNAARTGNTACAKQALRKGARLDATGENRWTALFIATFWQYSELIKFLVNAGADLALTDSKGRSPQTIAGKFCSPEIADYLKLAHGLSENHDQAAALVKNYLEKGEDKPARGADVIGIIAPRIKKFKKATLKKLCGLVAPNCTAEELAMSNRANLCIILAQHAAQEAIPTKLMLLKTYLDLPATQLKTFFDAVPGLAPKKIAWDLFLWALAEGKLHAITELYNFNPQSTNSRLAKILEQPGQPNKTSIDATPADGLRWHIQLLALSLKLRNWKLFTRLLKAEQALNDVCIDALLPAQYAPTAKDAKEKKMLKEVELLRATWNGLKKKNPFKRQVYGYLVTVHMLGHGLPVDLKSGEKLEKATPPLPSDVTSHILSYLGAGTCERIGNGLCAKNGSL
ncbi:MAG: ankyrin repeat domain-containing protein [Candidatus Dependentiae bacterium]|nr:ankyrin repeat domain-containing protein [Candidatus Dependentiae bacterium]